MRLPRGIFSPPHQPVSTARAKPAHQIDNQTNQEDETETATTDRRAAEVKAAATKKKDQDYNHEE